MPFHEVCFPGGRPRTSIPKLRPVHASRNLENTTMQHAHIRKAVFPVAGLGTRFLPATKARPKEMLPIVDKPLIQYAVEEAVAGGGGSAGVRHQPHQALHRGPFRQRLRAGDRARRCAARKNSWSWCRASCRRTSSCVYIRQAEALGLGHAVLCAEPAVGNEPFYRDPRGRPHRRRRRPFRAAADEGVLRAGRREHRRYRAGEPEETDRYGIITPKGIRPRLHR